jgi:hypothetical protein
VLAARDLTRPSIALPRPGRYKTSTALANHTIDQLEDGTTYTDSRGREQDKSGMVRWLSIEEKPRGAVPLFTKAAPLDKGREPWQRFKRMSCGLTSSRRT